MEYDPLTLVVAMLVVVLISAAIGARIKWMTYRDGIERKIQHQRRET